MADKTTQQKEVQSTVEEVDKSKTEEPTTEEDSKSENGKVAENGEEAEKENGIEEAEEKTIAAADDTDKVCSVKRKSTGGDATSETPAEGATPEKKAKLAETTEAESNGEAEVAA
ncbi:uncharacterized protein LOC123007156 [Tribolium madens]|uniref:uncharacterized protein LOC123007156 n=1 Tax=Tribolium madens TaxID=41895 RepID=UPI001CF72AAD|nr:uncharacterized protein LOC123007156 [Tribolium madens]